MNIQGKIDSLNKEGQLLINKRQQAQTLIGNYSTRIAEISGALKELTQLLEEQKKEQASSKEVDKEPTPDVKQKEEK